MLNQRRSQQRDIHGQTAHSVSSRGAIVGAAACFRPALPARENGTFGRGPQGSRDAGPPLRRSLEWEDRGGVGGRPSARDAVALHEEGSMRLGTLLGGMAVAVALAIAPMMTPAQAKNTLRWASQGDALPLDPHAQTESSVEHTAELQSLIRIAYA